MTTTEKLSDHLKLYSERNKGKWEVIIGMASWTILVDEVKALEEESDTLKKQIKNLNESYPIPKRKVKDYLFKMTNKANEIEELGVSRSGSKDSSWPVLIGEAAEIRKTLKEFINILKSPEYPDTYYLEKEFHLEVP